MLHELATVRFHPLDIATVLPKFRDWLFTPDSGAEVLGLWQPDIGTIGRLVALRRFDDADALWRARERTLAGQCMLSRIPALKSYRLEACKPFAFLPPVRPRAFGGVYEFRTYWLKPGGLTPTIEAWQAALGPAGAYTDHLVTNMFALDGPLRITHIWGFASVDARNALRKAHYAAGLWPPKGAPEQILKARSSIAFSLVGSALS